MTEAVETSAVFVLFISREALESVWVGHEMKQAELGAAVRRIKRVLPILLDRTIRVEELPEWLGGVRVDVYDSDRAVARLIQAEIDELLRAQQTPFFIGRTREIALVQEVLIPTNGSSAPRKLFLTGLPGIGRRTVANHVVRNLWSFDRTVQVDLEIGDSIQDIAAKLADLFESARSVAEAKRVTEEILTSSDGDARTRVAAALLKAASQRELVCFVDRNGMFFDDGQLTPAAISLVAAIDADVNIYSCFVSGRRLTIEEVGAGVGSLVDVRPLSVADSRRLLTACLSRKGSSIAATPLATLADHMRGYPPAAFFTAELVAMYGPDVVIRERDRIAAFRLNPTLQYLRSTGQDDAGRDILRVLAATGAIPLEVLVASIRHEEAEVTQALIRLIDSSLVVPDDRGWYRVSDPLVDGINREYGDVLSEEFLRIAASVDDYIDQHDDTDVYLSLSRVRFRTLVLGGVSTASTEIEGLATDLIQLAQQLYHQRDYERAVDAGRAAVEARPGLIEPRMWLARSLIKTENYGEAFDVIEALRGLGAVKEAWFYTGFLHRHTRDYGDAVADYKRAIGAGLRGGAVHRELALCYLYLENFPEAEKHIERVPDRQAENRFVIDLKIQIAVAQRDEASARTLLEQLALVDRPAFVAHRCSMIEDVFGDSAAAYRAAREAVGHEVRPPFEILAHLISCEIKMRQFDDAERHLSQLDELYSYNHDIKLGLRTRTAIARGRYTDALGLWEGFRDKTRPVHLNLRRDALRGLLTDTVLNDGERQDSESELAALDRELQGIPDAELDPLAGVR